MFTGIVQAVGRVLEAAPRGDGVRLLVDPQALSLADVVIGDSIAVQGCCLTVVERSDAPPRAAFDVSAETLACTTGLERAREVNLEKALTLADRLGGHLMTGHVDGVGTVLRMDAVGTAGEGSVRLVVEAPAGLARYIAAKGSVALDGVSLTVNRVDGPRFEINLIPHTLQVTTLHALAPGGRLNLEVDLIARYVERLAAARL